MENIIMPELITPEFAEVIAENPEVLKIIVDRQPGEEIIVGQNCNLDCSCNPTNVKLVFCNVTIELDDTEDECDKGCGAGKRKEQAGGCHIKIGKRDQDQEGKRWGSLLSEQGKLELEVAVLEARMEEIQKILRLIPRQIFNRKLVARCKKEMMEIGEQLDIKKKKLQYTAWLMEYGE